MRNRWQGVVSRHSRGLGVLFALYWCAMFAATHVEIPKVPSAPTNTDKLVHLIMYAGFAFLLSLWLSAKKIFTRRTMLFVASAAMSYGILDELLQMLTPSRTADVWDFWMDALGAIIGLLMFWLLHQKFPWLWRTESRRVHGDDSKTGLY